MKKGFTLIELLAVIVILAIIALIAVPLIINMIEESRIKSAVVSGRNYVKAVNYKIAQDALNDKITPSGEYVIGENELEVTVNNIETITGSYEIGEKGVLTAGLCINNYSIEYSSGKTYHKKDVNYCSGGYVFEEPEATLLSEVCKNPSLYDSKDKFKIYKADDLACLSNLVESGKNFSGKEIYLLRDININDTNSYSKPNTTDYGDINGNETVEGLYTELTTGAGFKPIGSDSKQFSGTFLGYAYTISNLMINRTTEYAGLFGYNNGTISGLKMRDANIKGKKYVGAVVGKNKNILKNIDATGNVVATADYVGGIVGENSNSATDLIFSGNVKGSGSVGGVAGSGWSGDVVTKGVAYDTTVESTSTSNSKRVGKVVGAHYTATVTARNSNVTLVYSGSRTDYADGVAFTKLSLSNLDDTLDTYIGGDNNSDGYYFDYDNDGNITLYSAARTPIQNKLKGEGTSDKPYLIKNAKDWRIVSSTVTQGKYYSLTNDIDFTDVSFYPLGTGTNKFNGHFNGNMNTISNISIEGYKEVAIFGYNTGTIEGLKLDTITIKASGENTGAVASTSSGTVTGIIGRNISVTSTASGNINVGGIVGKNDNILKNVDCKGTIIATGHYVGGVVGDNNKSATDLIFSGSVKGYASVGGVAGSGWSGDVVTKGVAYDTTVEATGTNNSKRVGKVVGAHYTASVTARNSNVTLIYSGTRADYTDGVTFSKLSLFNLDDTLDTYIGGDNDNDGYYFDYDENGNIILYSTVLNPINNTLKGKGTDDDPYKIANANDWRTASSTVTQGKYYSLTSDIDFTNLDFYPLGTGTNKFNGHFNGNMNTISNISIEGYKEVAIFGYNTGTIEGLKLDTITIKASGENTGAVASTSSGTVTGIIGRNISVTSTASGNINVGGIVGKNDNILKNVDCKGTITAVGDYVGGVVGDNNKTATDLVFSGSVKGSSSVGGVAGSGWSGSVVTKGFVYNTTVTSISTSNSKRVGKGIGARYTATYKVKNYNTSLEYTGSREDYADGTSIDSINIYDVNDTIDTYIDGDNDSDGYYFDYDNNNNITLYSVSERPIRGLSGSGTQADPYRISSVTDWNTAALGEYGASKYYALTADLNFANQRFYIMGTSSRKFNGHLNGNMHTISNVNVTGLGLFEYVTGSIEGLKLNNITVTSTGVGTGIIGTNEGIIKGIEAKNVTINSTIPNGDVSHTGGLVGINKGTIKTVMVEGNITSNKWRVGGIVGYNRAEIEGAVFKGTVSSNEATGGLVGKSDEVVSGKSLRITGFVYNSTISASVSNTNMGKTIGSAVSTSNTTKNMNVSIVGTRQSGYYVDGTEISELTTSNLSNVIDITDSDSDGYRFDVVNGNLQLLHSN